MHGSDQAPDRAVWPVKRALARLRRGGKHCAEPARRPDWLRALGATFLVAIAAGLPTTLAAGTAAASSSATSAGSDYCADGFNLSASPGQDTGEISLSWCEPVGDPDAPYGYYIEQGTSQGNESTPVNTSPLPDTTTSYGVTGLTPGQTYYFIVKAVNSLKKSVISSEAWATVSTGTYDGTSSPPGAPAQLSASPGDSQVSLSWTAPASDGSSPITKYNVYERTSQDSESETLVTTTSDTSATVTGLTNGTPYYFAVTAVNAVGESSWSNETSATPTPSGQQQGGRGAGSGQSGGGQSGSGQSGGGQSGSGQRGGQPAPSTSSALVPTISAGIGILVIIGSVIAVRRLRARPRPPSAPQPIVRVVRKAGPPGRVHVHPTGTQPTVAVRIEPHPGAITTLIEEMQR